MRVMLPKLAVLLALAGISSGATSLTADEINGNGMPNLIYRPSTGELTINPDSAQLIAVAISGPRATSIQRWRDRTAEDGIASWRQQYFDGKEQWTGNALLGEYVTPVNATYRIATYPIGLTRDAFGVVYMGAHDPENIGRGLFLETNVTFSEESVSPTDIDADGDTDIDDLRSLVRLGDLGVGIPLGAPLYQAKFDLDQNDTINCDDALRFLEEAATEHGWAEAYFRGDLNLDGQVGFQDFVNLNVNWQRTTLTDGTPVSYLDGDLNWDRRVDFVDFVTLNNNWNRTNSRAAAGAPVALPEPCSGWLAIMGLLASHFRRARRPLSEY